MRLVVLSPRFLNGVVRRLREAHERREEEAAVQAAQRAADDAPKSGHPLARSAAAPVARRNLAFAKAVKPDHNKTAAEVVDIITRKVGYVYALRGARVCSCPVASYVRSG